MLRIIPCSGRGLCYSLGAKTCDCLTDYYMSNCSVYCDNDLCKSISNSHGSCDFDGVCRCNTYYYPINNCTVFCNDTECQNNRGDNALCSGKIISIAFLLF